MTNDKDRQTPKMIKSKSPKSSPRKQLTLLSRKNSEKTPSRDLRLKECVVILTDVTKERQTRKSAVSSTKQKVEVKSRLKECVVILTDVTKERQTRNFAVSSKKLKAEVQGKTLRTRHSSETPSRNRISLPTGFHSDKTSNDLLSSQLSHTENREKMKKYAAVSKEQNKENVKNTNKSESLARQETEMLVHKHKRSDSNSKRSLKSKNHKCLNDKDPQTPKIIQSKSSKNTRSSPRKRLTLLSRKNSGKTSSSDLRLKESVVILTDVTKERQTRKSAVSSKKQKTEVKVKKNARKRPLSSPLETPIQKKRKLSVKFKKQAQPRSYSAFIPIDDLALTPPKPRQTKSDGFKFPGKNTLKRKRFLMDEIKKADDGYEDDIYESKTFDHFKDMFPDSSDSSELSCPIKTPKLASLLTPGIHIKTPAYMDCYSPTEYAFNRKIAEEYIYRNKRKRRTSQVETPDVPERKKLEFKTVVEKACAIQKEVEKLTVDSSDEEDSYFSEDI